MQQVLAENRTVVGGDGRQLIYVPMQGGKAAPATAPVAPLAPELLSPTVEAAAEAARPARSGRAAGREEVVR